MLLAYFLRVVLILFLLRIFFRFVGGLLRGLSGPAPRASGPPAAMPTVRDRVCNTFLPRERALVARIDGRDEYFCSEECRRKARRAARERVSA
jgi:YHS domain-containing protein